MGCGKHFEFFYEFETARSIRVKSKSIGLIYWTLFIAVFGYIIAYSMYMKKGYQVRAAVPLQPAAAAPTLVGVWVGGVSRLTDAGNLAATRPRCRSAGWWT